MDNNRFKEWTTANKWLKWVIVVVVIAIIGIVIKIHLGAGTPVSSKPTITQTVDYAIVGRQSKQPTLSYTGTVEAIQEAVINPKVSGTVTSVPVANGEMVTAGQTLVQLDDRDYRTALEADQAAVTKAQAELTIDQANQSTAQNSYNRDQQLFDSGALSKQDLENAQSALKVNNATVEAAQSDIASANTAVVSAQDNLQDTAICSPITGLVSDCTVKVGQYLNTMAMGSGALLTVEDISSVYAVVDVGENDLASVQSGMAADISTGNSARVFTGTVEQINPVADASSREFEVKIRIPNEGQALKPGEFVNVQIELGAPIEVIAVPQKAVISQYGQFYVFVADGNIARSTPVQVGQVFSQSVEIKSGLQEGQTIILTDVATLKDGDLVSLAKK
jgi:RND family efflux transporter MFP subunit